MKARVPPASIAFICLWAVGLAVGAVARRMLFSFGQTPGTGEVFALALWLVTTTYILALALACVGLWRLHNWGRVLMLALITLYYGSLVVSAVPLWGPLIGVSLWAAGQGWVTIVLVEAILGLGFGWWYLNREKVRGWFGLETVSGQVPGSGTEEK